ncbi:MAG: hypothetical protein AAGC60_29035 [Acidobacteriota bacterium]
MKLLDIFLLAFAVVLALFGAVIVVGASLGWSEEQSKLGHVLLTLVFGIGPLAAAGVLGRWTWRRVGRHRRERLERMLLDLGAAHGGRITVQQVAQMTPLTLTEAKELLDDLHRAGTCRLEVDADGAIEYCFGILSAGSGSSVTPWPASSA